MTTKGKTVLITGSTDGVGRYVAERLAINDVVIASDRASKDARPSGRAMAKQSRGLPAPFVIWLASSLRSSQ